MARNTNSVPVETTPSRRRSVRKKVRYLTHATIGWSNAYQDLFSEVLGNVQCKCSGTSGLEGVPRTGGMSPTPCSIPDRTMTCTHPQHKGARLVCALLYAANVTQPRMVQLPVSVDYDDAVDATGWVADVNTGQWFPHGSVYSGHDRVPGSPRQLKNRYTVVTSGHKGRAPMNKCVMDRFGLLVHGNVLVLRHASREPVRVTNMHSSERQFVDIIVEQ